MNDGYETIFSFMGLFMVVCCVTVFAGYSIRCWLEDWKRKE